MKSSNGTPIKIVPEWKGLIGSEAEIDPDVANQVIDGVDRYLRYNDSSLFDRILRFLRLPSSPVTVFVKGYWDGFHILDKGEKLPVQKEGVPPVWDVEAALAAWQNAEFKLATSNGKPILFHHEYQGTVGSEADHPEYHYRIIAGCDEALELYPDMPYVIVDVKGDWNQVATVKLFAKLPPPKEGAPKPSFDIGDMIRRALVSAALDSAFEEVMGGNGRGINPLAELATEVGFEGEDCPHCPAEDCPIRQEAYVGAEAD